MSKQSYYKIFGPSRGLPKYVKTKVLATCFYLILSFFKK